RSLARAEAREAHHVARHPTGGCSSLSTRRSATARHGGVPGLGAAVARVCGRGGPPCRLVPLTRAIRLASRPDPAARCLHTAVWASPPTRPAFPASPRWH